MSGWESFIGQRIRQQQAFNEQADLARQLQDVGETGMWDLIASAAIPAIGSYCAALRQQGRVVVAYERDPLRAALPAKMATARGAAVRCAYCRRERRDRFQQCIGCGATEVLR